MLNRASTCQGQIPKFRFATCQLEALGPGPAPASPGPQCKSLLQEFVAEVRQQATQLGPVRDLAREFDLPARPPLPFFAFYIFFCILFETIAPRRDFFGRNQAISSTNGVQRFFLMDLVAFSG